MSATPLVHTRLSPGGWEATAEVVPVEDPSTKLASLRVPIVFRGTRKQVLDAFKWGTTNAPHGGAGMFCLGPQDVRMIPHTGRDPHWDLEVEWVGLHSQITNAGTDWACVVMIDWTNREQLYPVDGTDNAGNPTKFLAPAGFAPDGNSAGNNRRQARRLDHLPTATITGILRSGTAPSPYHSTVGLMLARLPVNFTAEIEDYSKKLNDPVWVTWKGRPAPKTVANLNAQSNSNKWFPREIQNIRRIQQADSSTLTGMALHVFRITATLEQLIQPG